MKIRTPLIEVKDQLINFIAEGYEILSYGFQNFHDTTGIIGKRLEWEQKILAYFTKVFPTQKEAGQFQHTPYNNGLIYNGMHADVQKAVNRTASRIEILEAILEKLEAYYQFQPESLSIAVQDIDSFAKVRGVNHRAVDPFLKNGFFDKDEESIKRAFAEIIGESYVPKDWAGENQDLYTSRILFNGQRVQASIIFNGPGKVAGNETFLSDLGARGNQHLKMMRVTSSTLYILQSVKYVGEDIIDTFEKQIRDERNRGHHCYYCIIDGQDTAEILYAYGFLS